MARYFNKNLKFLRTIKGITQTELAQKIGLDTSNISYWENFKTEPTLENVEKVAQALNVSIPDLLTKDLTCNNATPIEINHDIVKIPLYGTIKAGIPMDAQEDIIDYVEIPKSWIKNNKSFYALKISGNSMSPKYNDNDIVVFENVDYYQEANNKDCAVMVNAHECTFKKVYINDNGITLQPYNSTDYQPSMYSKEQAEDYPIRIVGIAVRRITDILN